MRSTFLIACSFLLAHSDAACAGMTACRAEAAEKLGATFGGLARWPSHCARVEAPQTEVSLRAHLARGVPVAFANTTRHFGNLSRWADLGYLRRRFGHTLHEASVFDTREEGRKWGLHPWDTDAAGTMIMQPHKRVLTLDAALERSTADTVVFMEQDALFDVAIAREEHGRTDGLVQPEMWADVALPAWAATFIDIESANFWFGRLLGQRAKESPLHYDPYDNMLAQIKGRKKFVLFAAADSESLHPNYMVTGTARDPYPGAQPHDRTASDAAAAFRRKPRDERLVMEWDNPDEVIDNFSPVDLNAPNLTRHPLFKHARPCICVVEQGDVLFLPAFTWHNVYSWGDAEDHSSMALNFWWPVTQDVEDAHRHFMHLLRGKKPTNPRELARQNGLKGLPPERSGRAHEEQEAEEEEEEEEEEYEQEEEERRDD